MARQRVLYLCGQAPWLRNGGSMLRNYWLIDALAKNYAVDLVVADEPGPIPAGFAAIVDDYACFPRAASERTGFGRLARAARLSESTLTAGWTSDAMREHVADRVGRLPYSAIQVDLPMIGALPRRDAIPLVYNAHNCESALLARRARSEGAGLAAVLALEAFRVRRQEHWLVERSALVAACSSGDVADFERLVPGVSAKAAVVPNGVDVQNYAAIRTAPAGERTVLITGSMDWRPNIRGLQWFLRRVLPELRKRIPDVDVRVAGRMTSLLENELANYPNVTAIANPESMEPHLRAATVIAAPIVASSGTRLRVLEAWAAGRPVVTTTAGAFGLDHKRGEDLLVCDDPLDFARGVMSLLDSAELRAAVANRGVERVKAYDWPRIAGTLLAAYERVTHEPADRSVETVKESIVFAGRS